MIIVGEELIKTLCFWFFLYNLLLPLQPFFKTVLFMIITIARQCGCGAIDIGKMLSADYGVPFYTRKSLKDMASECGVLEELDDFFEERPVDELLFAISAFGADEGPLHSKALDVLSEMIGRRDCIIIGRCGNYIFRRRPDLVSVFLSGRESERIKVIAAERRVPLAEAKDFVRDMDNSRVRYHKYYTHLQWGNSCDYDLCFDSLRLGCQKSVELIERYIDSVGVK